MPSQRDIEMRQGAYMAAINAEREHYQKFGCNAATKDRRDTLQRWVEGGKVTLYYTNNNDREGRHRRDRVVVLNSDSAVRWIECDNDTWPSEQLLANVGMAIGALDSFDGVKEMTDEQTKAAADRRRRDEYRAHLTPPEFWDNKS